MADTITNSYSSLYPDKSFIPAADAVPDALVLDSRVTTLAAAPSGDGPVLRVPFVATDPEANTVVEGGEISAGDPALSEIQIHTQKVALVHRISNEAYESYGAAQNGTIRAADLLTDSLRRAIVAKCDDLFINNADGDGGDGSGVGLATNTNVYDGGEITDDLAPLIDAIAVVADNRAQPSSLLMSNVTWARLLRMSYADGHPVISPDRQAEAAPQLLGLPVVLNSEVGAGDLYVIDATAIISAMSDLEVTVDRSIYFTSDSVGIRVVARTGWALPYANRIARLTVADPDTD